MDCILFAFKHHNKQQWETIMVDKVDTGVVIMVLVVHQEAVEAEVADLVLDMVLAVTQHLPKQLIQLVVADSGMVCLQADF